MNLYYFSFKAAERIFFAVYTKTPDRIYNTRSEIAINYLGVGAKNFEHYLEKLKKTGCIFKLDYKTNSQISSLVGAFLAGRQKNIDIPTAFLMGTEFEKTVWNKAKEIAYGAKLSYKQLAEKVSSEIGKPKAYRAVGTALGKNPAILLVPCHRIIKSSGEIGNFSSGIPLKKLLLRLEAENKTINP